MTIDLYYTAGSGPCRAIMLLAKHLGLDLNLKHLNLIQKEQLAPEFVKLNPQHTVPTLVDNGFVIWESYAIIIYLAEKYGNNETLYPKDPQKRAIVNQRLFFDMGTLYRSFSEYFLPVFLGTAPPDPEKFTKMGDAVKLLDTFLEGHEYAAGNNLTIADFSLSATIATYDVSSFDLSKYKNVSKWYAKMKTVPGFEEFNGKEMLTKLFESYKNRK